MNMEIRQPIVTVLGHIDHGKTLLLDAIRGTNVQAGEVGGITQHIGASYIPEKTIRKICKELLEKYKIKIEIPGLLFIDTPGHKSFVSLRKRGGSISDLAILVIDINEGFKEQTDESLILLKQFKVPFAVAATKIDKVVGWKPVEKTSFTKSFEEQSDLTKEEVDKKIYQLVLSFAERGINADRFDRIEDFKKKIAIVPCSGKTGEGVAELLLVLCGLAQLFLKDRLKLEKRGRGNVLEVKEERGLGTTIDIILYDGSIERGDYLVIGGREPIVTKIRALLIPRPLQELRTEKKFLNIKKANAAAGLKVSALNLEKVVAGSPFIVCKTEKEIEIAKSELKKEIEKIEFTKDVDGIILKADSLGSLEALINIAKEEKIPIKKAEVGNVLKEDVIEIDLVKDKLKKTIFAFNVKVLPDAKELAKKLKIKIFENNIIYKIFEDYKKWVKEQKEKDAIEKLSKISRPVRIRVLKGYIFRTSKPCIVGVEVLAGKLVPGVKLAKDGKFIGKVKEIQKEGETIYEANINEKVAISMEEPIAGRHFKEEDVLESILSESEIRILKQFKEKLSENEIKLLEEFLAKV